MAARLGNITFDCNDVRRVSEFWSAALHRTLDPGSDEGFASIGRSDRERGEVAWFFERVPEAKLTKNRVHVDLVDSDPQAVDRLVSLGASIVAKHGVPGGGQTWTVLQDPEGNEFCVAGQSYTG